MPATIPQRVNLPVVVANHNQRIVANRKRKIVARIANLAPVTDKQPTPPPDVRQLGAINQLAGVKLTRQTVARLTPRDHVGDHLMFFGGERRHESWPYASKIPTA
jgi:hypothetical protein